MSYNPGRKFDSLRLSVTDACNLGCLYCRPGGRDDSVDPDRFLTFGETTRLLERFRRDFNLRSVRITGGEPLMRPRLEELIESIAGLGMEDIALTTNGQLLAPPARTLKRAGLDRVNISLDSLDPERYRRLTAGGELRRTLAGIEAAVDATLSPVKLNMVVLRGLNDDEVAEMVRFGLDLGCEVRFLELMAMGPSRRIHDRLYVSNDEVLARLREDFSLEAMESASNRPARRWRVHDGAGRMGTAGFISPESSPFCADCGRLRLSADGRLLGCLMYDAGIDLRPLLELGEAEFRRGFISAVGEVFGAKPRLRPRRSGRAMYHVGG